jgi:microcystin-dependent protein
MSLIIPTVGGDSGPTYAADINSSLTILDSHNHSSGSGVQINPSGLNINSALTFNTNPATNISYVGFSVQSAQPATSNSVYVLTGSESPAAQDLWYFNGTTAIQLTSGNAISGGNATLVGQTYNTTTGTFTWRQTQNSPTAPTTPANFDIGSVTIRPVTAGTSIGVTLASSGSGSYQLTLPSSLPTSGSSGFLTTDSSGNLSTPALDNSTVRLVSNTVVSGPAGSIIMFAGSAAPTGYLMCDGSAVSRTTYATLYSVIGTTYGSGDGSTTFNLPNTQGVFIRGAGSQTISGVSYSGTLGAKQNDAFASHTHSDSGHQHGTYGSIADSGSQSSPLVPQVSISGVTSVSYANIQPSGSGTETKPANLTLNYIIKT